MRLRLTAVGWALPSFEKLDMRHDIAGSRWLEELSFTSIEYVAVVMRADEGEGGI